MSFLDRALRPVGLRTDVQVAVGQPAPDFTLTDSDGQVVTLSEALKQGPVMLAFFPRAFTSGCTHELRTYTDQQSLLAGKGAQLFADLGRRRRDAGAFPDVAERDVPLPVRPGRESGGAVRWRDQRPGQPHHRDGGDGPRDHPHHCGPAGDLSARGHRRLPAFGGAPLKVASGRSGPHDQGVPIRTGVSEDPKGDREQAPAQPARAWPARGGAADPARQATAPREGPPRGPDALRPPGPALATEEPAVAA